MTEPIDVLEALLFASDTPVEADAHPGGARARVAAAARELVESCARRYEDGAARCRSSRSGGGFRLVTRPEVAPWLVQARAQHARAPAVAPRARDARDHRLPPAGVAARGGRRARRQLGGGARQPARAAAGPHRGAQGVAGPAVPLRDHARVPRRLRAARPRRPAEGGGRADRARPRAPPRRRRPSRGAMAEARGSARSWPRRG